MIVSSRKTERRKNYRDIIILVVEALVIWYVVKQVI